MASLTNSSGSNQRDDLPNILAIGIEKSPPKAGNPTPKAGENSSRKRYKYHTDEFINGNPKLTIHKASSLDDHPDNAVADQIIDLCNKAALKAIKEWGQKKSKITQLIFCTSTDLVLPNLHFKLAQFMSLSVKESMISMICKQGCSAAGKAFRDAEDLARNDASARVLIVCCELIVAYFPRSSETLLNQHEGSACFADGATAVIVGSKLNNEKPLFQIVSANQTSIPDSQGLPEWISDNIQQCYKNAVCKLRITDSNKLVIADSNSITDSKKLGMADSNKLFYVVHPGGPGIINKVEEKLRLNKNKLDASRQERGGENMRSPSVFSILYGMRKMSRLTGKTTTGEWLEYGILFAFGRVTMETIVLRSCTTIN